MTNSSTNHQHSYIQLLLRINISFPKLREEVSFIRIEAERAGTV